MKIIELKEIDSTNEYCKLHDTGEDMLVFAERQSAGRGTKGRGFSSETGGLYFSVLRHYKNFPAGSAFKIMINSCVSVCRALEKFGIPANIRWANDVLVCGRKISGTLIENTFSCGNIARSIVGTGINLNNRLPEELKEIAISASEYLSQPVSLDGFKAEIIKNVQKSYAVSDYLSYINWLGSNVKITAAEGGYSAVALGVEEDGRLIVDREGKIIKLSAGEVSLRL